MDSLIKVSEYELRRIKENAVDVGHLAAVKSYISFYVPEEHRNALAGIEDDKVRDVAFRYWLALSTSRSDGFLLERAWLKAAAYFKSDLNFSFPHIDPLVSG